MREMLAAMLGTWRQRHLPEIIATLANRPGHEAVRTHLADILRYGFGVAHHEIDHEVRLPGVHGRTDTLFGSDRAGLWPGPGPAVARQFELLRSYCDALIFRIAATISIVSTLMRVTRPSRSIIFSL
jgi:hypothetical protein